MISARGWKARASGAALALALIAGACTTAETPEKAVRDSSDDGTSYATVRAAGNQAIIQAPARLIPTATSSADLTFLSMGVVRQVFVQSGDAVERGDPILEIASPTLAEAAGEWRSAVDTLDIAEDRLARMEALAEERLASQDELQARHEDIARLRGRKRKMQAILLAHGMDRRDFDRIHLNGSSILASPIAGTVTKLKVRLGQNVGPDRSPLAQVVGAGRPRVEALLQDRATDALDYAFEATDGARFAVRSPPLGAVSDPPTGTWTTWFALAEEVELVGERVGELIGATRGADAFTIPIEALGRGEEGAFLARRTRENEVERLPAEVLHQDDEVAVVRAALTPSDEVALDPRAALRNR